MKEQEWRSVAKDGLPEEGRMFEVIMKSWAESRGGTYKRSGNLLLLNNGTDLIASAYSLDDIAQYCYLDSKPDDVYEIGARIEAKIMDIARSNRAKLNNIQQISLINRADINTLNSISEIEGKVIGVLINKVSELKSQVIENTTSITSLIELLHMNGVMDRIEPEEDVAKKELVHKNKHTHFLADNDKTPDGFMLDNTQNWSRDWNDVTCPDCLRGKPLTLADCRVGMQLVSDEHPDPEAITEIQSTYIVTPNHFIPDTSLKHWRIHRPVEDPKVHKHMGNGYPVCGANFYQSAYLVHKDDWSKVTCPDCLKHKPKPKLKIIHIPEDMWIDLNIALDRIYDGV